MAKNDSFEKATKNLKAAAFKDATKKANIVNLAAEFEKRQIIVDRDGNEQ